MHLHTRRLASLLHACCAALIWAGLLSAFVCCMMQASCMVQANCMLLASCMLAMSTTQMLTTFSSLPTQCVSRCKFHLTLWHVCRYLLTGQVTWRQHHLEQHLQLVLALGFGARSGSSIPERRVDQVVPRPGNLKLPLTKSTCSIRSGRKQYLFHLGWQTLTRLIRHRHQSARSAVQPGHLDDAKMLYATEQATNGIVFTLTDKFSQPGQILSV